MIIPRMVIATHHWNGVKNEVELNPFPPFEDDRGQPFSRQEGDITYIYLVKMYYHVNYDDLRLALRNLHNGITRYCYWGHTGRFEDKIELQGQALWDFIQTIYPSEREVMSIEEYMERNRKAPRKPVEKLKV